MRPLDLSRTAQRKSSLLCVALDPSEEAFPEHAPLTPEKAEVLLHRVIAATEPYAIAYKLNTAFYERWGEKGWQLLKNIRLALPSETLIIADAKRGDITHTNRYYAAAFWDELNVDAITVHPYLGWEALRPFTEREGRWVFVLLRTTEAPPWQSHLWRELLRTQPSAAATIGWVWGAHHADELTILRQERPSDWLLVPGLGAQGANLPTHLPLYPALLVVGRALLAKPDSAPAWAETTARYLPS